MQRFPLLKIRDKSSVNSYTFQTLFEFIIRLFIELYYPFSARLDLPPKRLHNFLTTFDAYLSMIFIAPQCTMSQIEGSEGILWKF